METEDQVRRAFWQDNVHLRWAYRPGKRQNAYNATIRSAFVGFVDILHRGGHISDRLAEKVTL